MIMMAARAKSKIPARNEDDLLSAISQDIFETAEKGPAINEKLPQITDKKFLL